MVYTYVCMSERLPNLPTYDFALPGSEVLSHIAEEVPIDHIHSKEIQTLIDAMLRIAYGEQGDKERKTMVGLAAPQIGVSKRVIIAGINAVGLGEQPELRAFINPTIVNKSTDMEKGREACYSTSRVCGIVERSKKVTVEAFDRDGHKVIETYEGFPARVFQHEIDHLDGIRFPDRISDDSRLHWVEPERFGEYRERWAEWEVPCQRQTWVDIKAGKVNQ